MGEVIRLSDHIKTKTLKKDFNDLSTAIEDAANKLLNIISVVKSVDTTFNQANAIHSVTKKNINEINESSKKLSTTEIEIQKIHKQTIDIEAKIAAGQTTKAKNLQSLRQQYVEQNKQIKETINLQKAEKGSLKALELSLTQLRNKYAQLSKTQREGLKGKELLKNIQSTDKEVKNLRQSMGQHQADVGNYGKAFNGVKGILGSFGLALGGAALATKLFNGVMQSTQTLADGFEKAMTQARAGVDFFFRTIATGDWKDFGKRFKEVMIAAGQYADTMDELGDLNRSLGVQQDKERARLAELQKIYSDTSNSEKVRMDAANEYLKIKKELADKSVVYAKEEYDAIIKNAAVQIGTSEENIKLWSEEYDKQRDLLKIGKDYNALIMERDNITAQLANTDYRMGAIMLGDINSIEEKEKRLIELNKLIAGTGDETKKAGEIQIKYKSTNKALLAKTAEAAKKYYTAQAEFDEETRRASTMLGSIKNQIAADEKRNIEEINRKQKEALDLSIKNIENNVERQINAEKEKYLKGEINEQQFATRILQIQMQSLQDQLNISNLTADQKLAIETRLMDARIALYKNEQTIMAGLQAEGDALMAEIDAEVEQEGKELNERILQNVLDTEDAKVKATEESVKKRKELEQTLIGVAQMAFDTANILMETETQNLETEYDYRMQLAGDNEAFKERVEKDFAKKRAELKRKQAITDKAGAIFNSLINTAQGITAAISLGLPGIILAVIIGALGAIQIASIASRPIPQYEKGVKNKPTSGLSEIAERGPEIVELPDGQSYIADKHQVAYIPKGANVIPAYETRQRMSEQGGISVGKWDEMITEQRETKKALKNMTIEQTLVTERGFEYVTKTNNTRINHINKYFRGE